MTSCFFLDDKSPSRKGSGLLKKKRIAPLEPHYFLKKLTPVQKGGKDENENSRVGSPESVPCS